MKKITVLIIILFGSMIYAQVGVNTTTPDPSSMLDISATNKGVLVPRVSLANVTATMLDGTNTAATGLLIWNTNAATVGGNGVGFYFFNGTQWMPISQPPTIDHDFYEIGTTLPPNNISDNIYHMGQVQIGSNSGIEIAKTAINSSVSSNIIGLRNVQSGGDSSTIGYGFYNLSNITDIINYANIYNANGGTHNGQHYGINNQFDNNGTGQKIGILNEFNFSSPNGLKIGTENRFEGGNSNTIGVRNSFPGAWNINGIVYGIENNINAGGNGTRYGAFTAISGSGTGNKFGYYINIDDAAEGLHYGIYSDVQKSTGYAGYFLGRTSFGSGSLNRYLMPDTDGSAGQVITTDGAGNLSFQNASINTDDQNLVTPTLVGTTLNLNIENGTGTSIDLAPLQDGIGTDNQTLNLAGNNLSISGGNSVNLSSLNTDDQNLITPTLIGTTLNLNIENGTGTSIDLAPLQDGTGTDDQIIDNFSLSGTTLRISLENDGQPLQTVNLASINTDDQNLVTPTLVGTTLNLNIENGTGTSIDLAPLNDHDWYEVGGTTPPDDINDAIYTQGSITIGSTTSGTGQVNIRGTNATSLDINNTNTGNQVGINLNMTSDFSNKIGIKTEFSGLDNNIGGISSFVQNNDTAIHGSNFYGIRQNFLGQSSNIVYGISNLFPLASGYSGDIYSVYNSISNTGTGTKYGTYNLINTTAGGTHYGLYSEVLKSGSYAGYFLGNVSIGTTSANNYILPASRGTNGQIMQTNGTGTVNWVNPSAVFTDTDDQNIQNLAFNTTTNVLTVGIENGTSQTVSLATLATGGDIQGVTAGAGLTGGGITGTVTINAAANNGLNVDAGADSIQLGGPLVENTSIEQGIYSLDINLDNTGDFSIQDNGTDVFFVEDTGDIGIGTSNPGHPLHIVESVAGTVNGVYIDKTDDSASNTSGLFIQKTGSGDGRSHAIFTNVDGTGIGQKYGIFNNINSSANGNQYGTRNFINGATPSFIFGTFNNLDNAGTGNQYGVYNGMRGIAAANLYGTYNEFNSPSISNETAGVYNSFSDGTPGSGGIMGVFSEFSNSNNGVYYGSRNSFTNAATGTGTKYGTYNIISGTAGGTHYGTYNSVSVTSGWAGYFIGRNYISDRLSIGVTNNNNAALNINKNSTGTYSHIELTETTANDGSRIKFNNNAEADNEWVLYGRADNTVSDSRFNIFHNGTGDIVRITGDGLVGIMRTPATNALEVNGNASKTVAGGFLANSDSRLKKDISTISPDEALDKILKLRGVTYYWNDDKTGTVRPQNLQIGFIAQEIAEVFPDKVTEDNLGYLQTAYGDYDPIVFQAIKALNDKIEKLEKENAVLKSALEKINALEAKLDQMNIK